MARCVTEICQESENRVLSVVGDTAGASERALKAVEMARASKPATSGLSHLVLKFTTVSSEGRCAGLRVRGRTRIGRGEGNEIRVACDVTMAEEGHAVIDAEDGAFCVRPGSESAAVGVRVSREHSLDWPLAVGASFAAASSVAVVESLADDSLQLFFRSGPLAGEYRNVCADATLGRSTENTIAVADKELSRFHVKICRVGDTYYLRDLSSTNGTYMRLEGPYAGPCKLCVRDQILVARTGFSVNRFDYGVAEERGARQTMEDRSIVVQDLFNDMCPRPRPEPYAYAAVFDGHGGTHAASFLRKRLHYELAQAWARALNVPAKDSMFHEWPCSEERLRAEITTAFLTTDDNFIATSEKPRAGSTAVVVVVATDTLCCANVGDSRAILCRDGTALPLSRDHKPSRDDEAARIREAGGFVIHKRVMGELAVSRAFGDAELKKTVQDLATGILPEFQPIDASFADSTADRRLVVAEPEIIFHALDKTKDEFILLACDGLFDVFTDADAVSFVAHELSAHADPQLAAERLVKAAIADRGSRDNVTVLVLALNPTHPGSSLTAHGYPHFGGGLLPSTH